MLSAPTKKFTRHEVEQLLATDFFAGQRYELIDGDLIEKMGQNPPHAAAIRRVSKWLRSIFGDDRVQVQLPIDIRSEDTVPEPDVAVLAELKAEYEQRHPRGDELVLVVEVADTSAAFDLSRKAILYAAADVPEYWVLDLNRRTLAVHRHPERAQYRLIERVSPGHAALLEGHSVRVEDLLPSPA